MSIRMLIEQRRSRGEFPEGQFSIVPNGGVGPDAPRSDIDLLRWIAGRTTSPNIGVGSPLVKNAHGNDDAVYPSSNIAKTEHHAWLSLRMQLPLVDPRMMDMPPSSGGQNEMTWVFPVFDLVR